MAACSSPVVRPRSSASRSTARGIGPATGRDRHRLRVRCLRAQAAGRIADRGPGRAAAQGRPDRPARGGGRGREPGRDAHGGGARTRHGDAPGGHDRPAAACRRRKARSPARCALLHPSPRCCRTGGSTGATRTARGPRGRRHGREDGPAGAVPPATSTTTVASMPSTCRRRWRPWGDGPSTDAAGPAAAAAESTHRRRRPGDADPPGHEHGRYPGREARRRDAARTRRSMHPAGRHHRVGVPRRGRPDHVRPPRERAGHHPADRPPADDHVAHGHARHQRLHPAWGAAQHGDRRDERDPRGRAARQRPGRHGRSASTSRAATTSSAGSP